ncbi:MoaD/ThiS family protein [Candidatus Woesearchaeota archaeon]|nr:MoaD/ThiS family protein [Candidatus Woesearchaeota archaeon]
MKVLIEKDNQEIEITKACTGFELLAQLSIVPTTVLIVRNGEIAFPEEKLAETDDVKLLSVISGG